MTQEEKAKAYDEALERARQFSEKPLLEDSGNIVEYIFPELKESEDERIRKWLIELVEEVRKANPTNVEYNGMCGEAIVWLEKQGEQKPVPKFKVGDTMRTLQEATDGYTDGMPVVASIDEEYYHCNNELIAIKDQDDYEYPPINRRQKPTDKVEPKF